MVDDLRLLRVTLSLFLLLLEWVLDCYGIKGRLSLLLSLIQILLWGLLRLLFDFIIS